MARRTAETIERIEGRMAGLPADSVRYKVLDCARTFKTSWVGLGQALYSVWKDKSYREWGYATFDAYASKEIGIRKATAVKLLKSYYFLEKEEPSYLEGGYASSRQPNEVASLDSINVLRLARNKKIEGADYVSLRRGVLELGRDASQAKKDLVALMRERAEEDPEEVRRKKRQAAIRRTVGMLKALRRELEASKMLPSGILKEISSLVARLETEIGA